MRLSRDVSGVELANKLEQYSYRITRQTGSHLRLTTQVNGEHHMTFPAHKHLTIGKVNAILRELVEHFGLSRQDVLDRLLE